MLTFPGTDDKALKKLIIDTFTNPPTWENIELLKGWTFPVHIRICGRKSFGDIMLRVYNVDGIVNVSTHMGAHVDGFHYLDKEASVFDACINALSSNDIGEKLVHIAWRNEYFPQWKDHIKF